MKFFNKFLGVCVVTLLILTAPVASQALIPSPPIELTAIFNDYGKFETAFKNRKWDEALTALDGIDATFAKMLPHLAKDIKNNPAAGYHELSNNLKTAVKAQDIDATQNYFIELHKLTFTLISKYEYKTRPVFLIIAKYIAEAEEANSKKEFNRVVSEIDEISSILGFAENYLESSDANRRILNDIKAKFLELRVLAVYKKRDEVKTELKSLKKSFSALAKR